MGNYKRASHKIKNEDELLNRISNLFLNEISDDETQIYETLITTNKTHQQEAKMIELDRWRNEQVYDEIDDLGQQCISPRWVMKEKVVNETKIIKACLCARGFEEEQNFRTDSPTCSREGLQLSCCIISFNRMTLNSLDVKTAFLQGKIMERTVFARPPKEASTNKIWKLRKCIYGLADASRY